MSCTESCQCEICKPPSEKELRLLIHFALIQSDKDLAKPNLELFKLNGKLATKLFRLRQKLLDMAREVDGLKYL